MREDLLLKIGSILDLPLQSAKPLDGPLEEALYGTAFAFYEVGSYAKGAQLFTQLLLSDPFASRYWKGLAACRQLMGEYTASLHAWGLLALLQDGDPLPHFHAAECLLSLNEDQEAFKALDAAKMCLKDRSDDELSEKIELLRGQHA